MLQTLVGVTTGGNLEAADITSIVSSVQTGGTNALNNLLLVIGAMIIIIVIGYVVKKVASIPGFFGKMIGARRGGKRRR